VSQDTALAAHDESPGQDVPWKRIDARTALAQPLDRLAHLVPFIILSAVVSGENRWILLLNALAASMVCGSGLSAWLTTRYRVTDEYLEVRRGFLIRNQAKVPRERIRAIDFTSGYAYRILRITHVRIGTGQHRGITLTAVSRPEGTRLRTELLRGVSVSRPTRSAKAEPLASFAPGWLRYAPLSLSGWAVVTTLASLLFNIGKHYEAELMSTAAAVTGQFAAHSMSLPIVLILTTVAVVLAVGSMGIYVLNFWNFELKRTDDLLHIHRGLLTTYDRSLAGHRVRGYELIEELFIRWARGGKLTALTTGLGAAGDRVILLPANPLRAVRRLFAELLRADVTPLHINLARHPRAALRRRLVRTVAPVLVATVTVTCIVGVGPWLWIWALLPPAVALGWDRYRSLGHAMTDDYLVSRSGSIYRHTVALQRGNIIGWRVRQSWGQRRADLMTLTAATAAGRGGYSVVDVDAAHALRLAARAVPGMIDDMLGRDERDAR
jgi:putative membrane protein